MSIQVVIYSLATGRVRGAVDPTIGPGAFIPPNALDYLKQVTIKPGEGRVIYNKKSGGPVNDLFAWQAAVNAVTGKSVQVGVDANDTYAVVDPTGLIVSIKYSADPLCGDFEPNSTLVQSTTMQVGGTWIGGVYTPP